MILIAGGFDEEPVAGCVRQVRQAGIVCQLVGLVFGPVVGQNGLKLWTDASLETALIGPPPQWLIVAGGVACTRALGRDPRVQQLAEAVLNGGGQVALTATARPALRGDPAWARLQGRMVVQPAEQSIHTFTSALLQGRAHLPR